VAEHWVVTGANRGLGLEFVRRLTARGDRVTACVRDEAARLALGAQLAPQHAAVDFRLFDQRDAGAVAAAGASTAGPVDVLIANAGAFGPSPQAPLDLDTSAALDLFSINALGPLRVAQAFLPKLFDAPNPRVVLMSSQLGSTTDVRPETAAYAASKAALNKFAQCLAAELKLRGVTVIALHPGWVRTDMGGPNAPLAPHESVEAAIATIDALGAEQTGAFLDYAGRGVPW
jgi:NAD(P)-dependent dehydrogenase (short-subunit alcohol dehydrogenase family)